MLLILFFLGINTIEAQGRLIRKIQQKAEDKIIEDIFNDSDKKETETLDDGTESSSSTRHRKGGGLSQDTPDVLQYISDAENAFEEAIKQFSEKYEKYLNHKKINIISTSSIMKQQGIILKYEEDVHIIRYYDKKYGNITFKYEKDGKDLKIQCIINI